DAPHPAQVRQIEPLRVRLAFFLADQHGRAADIGGREQHRQGEIAVALPAACLAGRPFHGAAGARPYGEDELARARLGRLEPRFHLAEERLGCLGGRNDSEQGECWYHFGSPPRHQGTKRSTSWCLGGESYSERGNVGLVPARMVVPAGL